MTIYAKIISSWAGKVLIIDKVYVSSYLKDAAPSAALVLGVSLMSIL